MAAEVFEKLKDSQLVHKDLATPASVQPGHEDHDSSCLVDGLAICKVAGFQDGLPVLTFETGGLVYKQRAIAVACDLNSIEIGAQVCACFDQKKSTRPVVLGKLVCDVSQQLGSIAGTQIQDDRQITLRCGKASISLKSDGTVAIRGTNIASRASHTNRIRGGNVQIN